MRWNLRGPGAVGAWVLALLVATVGLAGPAAASVLWASEDTMVQSNYLRSTFIYDVGAGNRISYEQFAAPAAVEFYTGQGFDRNFLYWAPIVAIDRPSDYWHACKDNHGGLCAPGDVVPGKQLIVDEIGSGQIHVKLWGGAFIGTVCGNWNHPGGGPVPRITGAKYEDLNGDGLRQAGEPGLAGWTIQLTYNGSVVATTTTAGDGTYTFLLDAVALPIGAGTYGVSEVEQPGWVRSAAPSTVQVGYGDGDRVIGGMDFGNYRPATISGRKFEDRDVDGSGAGEPGLPGWTITLDDGSTTTTAGDGGYQFTGLRPGTYTVGEVQQPGWRQTAPSGGTSTVTVTSGQSRGGVDLGNVCLGDVSVIAPDGVGVRVEEVDVPGILANEPALPRLGSGTTTIGGLLPGTYRVVLSLPDGVYTTDPGLTALDGGFAIVRTVDVAGCGTTEVAPPFVTSEPGKITGGVRIAVPGGFATAGFEFQQTSGDPRGTLEFNDHAGGLRIHTSDITGISVTGSEAYVFGHADIDGAEQSFRLHLVDAGEPGTSDVFELLVSDGYGAGVGATIEAGNIQIH